MADGYKLRQIREILGPDMFQPQAHWCYFSLTKHRGRSRFPFRKSARRWAAGLAGKGGHTACCIIWDPELTRTIRDEDILSNGNFSIFSGWEVTGWPVATIRRGEGVVREREDRGGAG